MSLLEALGLASMVFVAAFTWHAAFVQAHTTGQTPRQAIVEAWVNIVIGFSINYSANLLVIPLAIHGGHLGAADNFWMGWVFTTISIVRQFAIRRWFNDRIHAAAARLAGPQRRLRDMTEADFDEAQRLEAEHFGDPVKRTGVYARRP